MNSSKISIVIVNYNSGNLLKECINSILSLKEISSDDMEIIVVDNASKDNSCQIAFAFYNQLVLIKNDFNIGFPKACNQGIKASSGDILILLNPDTLITKEAIKFTIEGFSSLENVGIVGIAQKDLDNYYSACYPFPSLKNYCLSKLMKIELKPNLIPLNVLDQNNNWFYLDGYVSGSFLAISSSTIERIGLMDENLFWIEDADWCRRAIDAGFKIAYSPNATITHYRSAIAKNNLHISLFYQYTSKIRYFKKYMHPLQVFALIIMIAVEVLAKLSYTKLRGLQLGKSVDVEQRISAYKNVLYFIFRDNNHSVINFHVESARNNEVTGE
jgi:N-acetylglucosaminyl-diphospho-decaprenol L-rhamnosyltransferase